jgi:hypothetical protein
LYISAGLNNELAADGSVQFFEMADFLPPAPTPCASASDQRSPPRRSGVQDARRVAAQVDVLQA